VEFIGLEVLMAGQIFPNADFRACAIASWFEKYGNRNHVKPFHCSAGWISHFKKRHYFPSRAFHSKRLIGDG
jgi:hypothetical protein